MNRTIEIIIAPTGEIQIDAVGFKGPDCEKATQFLEEALGVVGKKIKKTEASGHLMQRGEEWGLVVDFSRLETKRLVLIRLESAGVEVALRTDSD